MILHCSKYTFNHKRYTNHCSSPKIMMSQHRHTTPSCRTVNRSRPWACAPRRSAHKSADDSSAPCQEEEILDFIVFMISMISRGREDIYPQYDWTLSAGGTPGGLHSLTRLLGGPVAAGVASQTHSECSVAEAAFWWIRKTPKPYPRREWSECLLLLCAGNSRPVGTVYGLE